MRKKFLVLSAVAATALAGCGGSAHKSAATLPPTTARVGTGTATTPPTTGAVTTSVPPTSASTAASTTASPTTTVPSGPPPCQTANLTANLGAPNGAAGTVYYALTLTNKGSSTCTLYGYAGVSLVTGSSGNQVGAAAARAGGATPTVVTVAPSASAHATLGITEAANYGSGCQITPVTGLRVYPPGQTAALFIPHSGSGCANSADILLHVGAFVAG